MKKSAMLFRMHTNEHICPFGLRSKDLLARQGFKVTDHKLATREEVDKFKKEQGVETTPQTYINGERLGGYDDLRYYFCMKPAVQTGTTYTPLLATFAIALLMAIATAFTYIEIVSLITVIELFVAFSMTLLAIQKMSDLFAFTNSFITYDLLAMRHLRYAYVYPFAEAFAGLGMLAALSGYLVGSISLFIGTVGAVSVFKAVYVDKRELKCACVGGNSNVPLGLVSLIENLFMIIAGAWMLSKASGLMT